MKYGHLLLAKKEYVYIKRILNISGYAEDFEIQKSLHRLGEELRSAHIVDEADLPLDVIRFNSNIRVLSNNSWEKTLQLVIPSEKDVKNDKISILTPMGAALFGYSEGDVIEWEFPTGKQQVKIVAVSQQKNKNLQIPA